MLSRNKLLLAIMLSNGVSTAIAQERGDTNKVLNGESLEVITVYGRQENMTVKDVAQTVNVFDQQAFEIGLFDTVGDALRLVPNATRAFSSQDMFADDYLFRGFDAEQSINGLGFIQTDHPTDLANVERIEVLKGPASVLYGQMEPGGTINVVTKQPLSEFRGEVGLEYGSHEQKRSTLDVTGPLSDNVRARLNVAYQGNDSHIDFLNHQRLFVAPNITIDLGDKTNLTIEGSYSDNEWTALHPGAPIEGAIEPNPNGDYYESFNPAWKDGYTERDSQYLNARLTHAITDRINARASYTYVRNDSDFQEYAPYGIDEDLRTLNRIIFASNDAFKKDHNLILDISGEVETGMLTHNFTAGLDYRSGDASRPTKIYFIDAIDLYAPVYGPVDWSSAPLVRDRDTFQYDDVAALFVQNRMTVTEDLHVLAGLRYIDSRQSQELIDHQEERASDDTIRQDDWTTQLGVIYDLGQSISVYTSRSESFVPQQGTTSGKIPLEAEEGTQYEVGVRLNIGGLQANAAVFDITKENIAIADPLDLDAEVAEGKARSRGAELSVTGYVTSNWYLSVAYGYTDTEILHSDDEELEGNRFGKIPYHTAALQTRYYVSSIPGFSLGGTASYTDERFGYDDNSFTLPSHTRIDLGAYYEVSKAVHVDLLVNNVTSEEIFSAGSFNGVVREPERVYLARLNYLF